MERVPHLCYVVNRRARFFWSTLRGYLQCGWWHIGLGKGCRFHGRTFFRRYPLSRIVIGNECTFLSSPNANLIGVNRPCMISTMTGEAQVRIGHRCGFSGTVLAAFVRIELGDNVICGANTLITDSDWHPEDPRAGAPAPVVIGNNVWLGVNATVLKGARIGDNSVIGAGSIVVCDIPANVVAAGNPCKVIKQLTGAVVSPERVSELCGVAHDPNLRHV